MCTIELGVVHLKIVWRCLFLFPFLNSVFLILGLRFLDARGLVVKIVGKIS